ncbi:MAG: ABC transporter permease [Spirochaetia bacterium]|jgi:simple sugar transport system permease protein|nr:ABC transporter permease [Spirochaetia bacterium]
MKKTRFSKSENYPLYVTIIILFILMSLVNGRKFLSWDNVSAMTYQMPMIGLLALGMMVSELSGGINLSIVANANFNGIFIYVVLNALTKGNMMAANGGQFILALVLSFLMTMLIGALNGYLIAAWNIPALLETLGMMTLLKGISLVITQGYTISDFPDSLTFLGGGSVLGIPMSLIIFVAVCIIVHIILDKTVFGKQLYFTGANPVAARFSNINVNKVIIKEYMLSAFFAYVCSLIMIGQMNSVKATYYDSYLLIAVLASFLGGVDPAGGFGKLLGTVLASIILQIISTGLNLMRLDPFMVTATWGAIIIIVLFGREIAGKFSSGLKRKGAVQ